MLKRFFILFCFVLSTHQVCANNSDMLNSTLKGAGIGLLVGIGAGTVVGVAARDFTSGSVVFGSCILAGSIGGVLVAMLDKTPSSDKAALINFDQGSQIASYSLSGIAPLVDDKKITGIFFNLLSARFF